MPNRTTSKKTTMQDIADRLNISKNAVSLALNNKPGVSEETRQMVLSLATKLNYEFSRNSSSLSSKNILVFIPEYIRDDSHFYNDIYWSVDYYSDRIGYIAIMTTITEEMQRNKSLPKIAEEISFIGILLVGVFDELYISFLENKCENILSIDHSYYDQPVPSVVTANLEGAYVLTKHVISCGHKKIGFIGSIHSTSSLYERWCGFNKALKDFNITTGKNYNIQKPSPLNVLLSDPEELKSAIEDLEELPTAFICGGDRIAIACIEALRMLSLKVPEDISVVGFDDIEMAKYIQPPLTTMHVRRKEMGHVAVKQIIKQSVEKLQPDRISLAPSLILRSSLKNNS